MIGSGRGVDWDDGNREKCQKHGVSIAEIEALLSGDARVAPDLKHSGSEDCYIAVGRNRLGRALFVAFTLLLRDGERLLHPVSARYMHGKEIDGYEAQGSQDDDR